MEQNKSLENKAGKKRARLYSITQYERHPKTGEILLTEEKIKQVVYQYRTIKRWAYIRHDKDLWGKEDEYKNSEHKEGVSKPVHFHIIMEMKSNTISLETISKWFGVAQQYVEVPKGITSKAFMDCLYYFTHDSEKEQAKGKVRYGASEIVASFDAVRFLQDYKEMIEEYGVPLTPKERMGQMIKLGKLTLTEAEESDPILYANNETYMEKARKRYINTLPMPSTRINFYIYGAAGSGKDKLCQLFALALFCDKYPNRRENEIYFTAGAKGATFERYDGQPVIIWSDVRGRDLRDSLGDKGNVLRVFDTFPVDQSQNCKFGSVRLTNQINIVNSVQPYEEFVTEITGKEDRGQVGRRFPIFCEITKDMIDMYINEGIFRNTRFYDKFQKFVTFKADIPAIIKDSKGNMNLKSALGKLALSFMVTKYDEAQQILQTQDSRSNDEILEQYKNDGTGKEYKDYIDVKLVDSENELK